MKVVLGITFITTLLSCDGGIEPQPVVDPPGFSGTIYFLNEWPAHVARTHIVMFKDPLESTEDFSVINIRYISNEIPYGATSYDFSDEENYFEIDFEPGNYGYLAVAQSNTSSLSLNREDWVVVGVYTDNDNQTPIPLTLKEGVTKQDINITCDFLNSPPQPPGAKQNP